MFPLLIQWRHVDRHLYLQWYWSAVTYLVSSQVKGKKHRNKQGRPSLILCLKYFLYTVKWMALFIESKCFCAAVPWLLGAGGRCVRCVWPPWCRPSGPQPRGAATAAPLRGATRAGYRGTRGSASRPWTQQAILVFDNSIYKKMINFVILLILYMSAILFLETWMSSN